MPGTIVGCLGAQRSGKTLFAYKLVKAIHEAFHIPVYTNIYSPTLQQEMVILLIFLMKINWLMLMYRIFFQDIALIIVIILYLTLILIMLI